MSTKLAGGHTARLCLWLWGVRPGTDVPERDGAAGLGERLGDIGVAVVAHRPPALDTLAFESGVGAAHKADPVWRLLVLHDFDGSARAPFGVATSRVASSAAIWTFS
jgi:hypothetical protein